MRATLMVVGLLVSGVLAGCVSAPEAPAAVVAVPLGASAFGEDVAGDAYEPSMDDDPLTAALCMLACPEGGAGEAAPYFDILRFGVEDQTDDVILTLTIASLAEGFPELQGRSPGGFHRSADYWLCFGPPGDESAERCSITTITTIGGVVSASTAFQVYHHDCNEWAACAWSVPVAIEYGEPAILRISVPKAYALWDGDTRIAWIDSAVGWFGANPATPAWHTAYSVNAGGDDKHQHLGLPVDLGATSDRADIVDVAIDLAPSIAPASRAEGPLLVFGEGNNIAHKTIMDKPELDILSFDLHEEGDEIVAEWTVASFEAMPTYDFLLIAEVGVTGKEVWEFGYIKEPTNGAYGYIGHCISYECAGDMGGDHEEHDMSTQWSDVAESEVIPGTPGIIRVRAPIAMFPSIVKGDTTNLMLAVSMYDDASVWAGIYGDPIRADWHKMSFIDMALGGAPHTFDIGNAPEAAGHGH